jgi:uncharacterized protein YcsI (UPF0317 family)
MFFALEWFVVGCVLNLAVQELAKAGKAWKDDFVTRPVSSPFALKSAMVTRANAISLGQQCILLPTFPNPTPTHSTIANIVVSKESSSRRPS